jgi:Asp-tRNA(Asn)/Glu-tRNA(Gln) amidotransferase A subunit family amidase
VGRDAKIELLALSVPCGFSRDGRPFDEATVPRVGHAYQSAADWYTQRPAPV